MRAFSTASGGVIFIAEEIERCSHKQSMQNSEPVQYRDLITEPEDVLLLKKARKNGFFGLFKTKKTKLALEDVA